MSVFLLSDDHIDLLVSYASRVRPGDGPLMAAIHHADGTETCQEVSADRRATRELPLSALDHGRFITPTQLGRVLLAQNVRSILHRHGNEDAETPQAMQDRINGYTFRQVFDPRLTGDDVMELAVITACRCYRYQSGETGDLHLTHAGQWITAVLEDAAATLAYQLPEDLDIWDYTRP